MDFQKIIKRYWWLIAIVVLLSFGNKLGLKQASPDLYAYYKSTYITTTGAVISNHLPVSWCENNNGCIGCGNEITSESVGRLLRLALSNNDKTTFDKEVSFITTTMQNKDVGFLKWKLNPDGTTGTCGGENTAIDADLISIQALISADAVWPGNNYKQVAISIMNGLKSGLINNTYIPSCMYPQGNEARPCTNLIKLGYIDLNALQSMCNVDSTWCPVYTANKNLMLGALTDKGIYSTYDFDTGIYNWENADIEPNWVFEHLALHSATFTNVETLYTQAKNLFMINQVTGGQQICQEFNPTTGCKISDPPWRVFAMYLDIAKSRGDTDFAVALAKILNDKIPYSDGAPLPSRDHYGCVVILQSLSGVTLPTQIIPPTAAIVPDQPAPPVINNFFYNVTNQNSTNNYNTTNTYNYNSTVNNKLSNLFIYALFSVVITLILFKPNKKVR